MSLSVESELLLHKLQERVKELTALHKTARLLQNDERPVRDVLHDVVNLLPAAWQFSENAAAQIRVGDIIVETPRFGGSKLSQVAAFSLPPNWSGRIEVIYFDGSLVNADDPFLPEERDLIDSLAEMLRAYMQHKIANENLERLVQERTTDLRRLAAELSLAEARKSREIAVDLHDHVIQEFAFIKLRMQQFRGDAVFSGLEGRLDEILALIERTIQFTRKLTFEISTPILYELGLKAALEWLAEQFELRHNLKVRVEGDQLRLVLPEAIRITLFRCVQELLTNCVKYAAAQTVTIRLHTEASDFSISVRDDGVGFDASILAKVSEPGRGFGLFSIRERLRYFGGSLVIESNIGLGTNIKLLLPLETA